jgi:hypothetical protein
MNNTPTVCNNTIYLFIIIIYSSPYCLIMEERNDFIEKFISPFFCFIFSFFKLRSIMIS